jgi:hypothetical protein
VPLSPTAGCGLMQAVIQVAAIVISGLRALSRHAHVHSRIRRRQWWHIQAHIGN